MLRRVKHLKNSVVSSLQQILSILQSDHERHKENHAGLVEVVQKSRDSLLLITKQLALSEETRSIVERVRTATKVLMENNAVYEVIDNQTFMMLAQAEILQNQKLIIGELSTIGQINQDAFKLEQRARESLVALMIEAEKKNAVEIGHLVARLNEAEKNRADEIVQLKGHIETLKKKRTDIAESNVRLHPELELIRYLFPVLQSKIAIDAGAHEGDFSGALLTAGYEVFAFEPFPASFERLRARLGIDTRFHGHQLALGAGESTMDLQIASSKKADIPFSVSMFNSLKKRILPADVSIDSTLTTQVVSLDYLIADAKIPSRVGVLKVDTEGFDLEVLRGATSLTAEVAVLEYCDPQLYLWTPDTYKLLDLVAQMHARGYYWYVVMTTRDGSYETMYYVNLHETVPSSWGNVFFFRDYEVFAKALKWCELSLRRVQFVAALDLEDTAN